MSHRELRRLAAQYILLILLCGCGTPESVRQTNYLNGEAAKWIVDRSGDPEIDRAATTISAGTDQIARKLGEPEVYPKYSPEVHEATVAQAKGDLDSQDRVKQAISGWVESLVVKVADLVLPGLGGTLLGAWFWLRKKTQYDTLKKGADVVVRAVEKIPAAKEAVAALAGKVGAGAAVDELVKMTKK